MGGGTDPRSGWRPRRGPPGRGTRATRPAATWPSRPRCPRTAHPPAHQPTRPPQPLVRHLARRAVSREGAGGRRLRCAAPHTEKAPGTARPGPLPPGPVTDPTTVQTGLRRLADPGAGSEQWPAGPPPPPFPPEVSWPWPWAGGYGYSSIRSIRPPRLEHGGRGGGGGGGVGVGPGWRRAPPWRGSPCRRSTGPSPAATRSAGAPATPRPISRARAHARELRRLAGNRRASGPGPEASRGIPPPPPFSPL